ncbi:MAG: High affinity Ca2+/Mn2+ P-type ATPase-like protein [Geoglossum simile]|nr:MAG: High affinity Ca2+/Mn2+ P-type ATPase-like protein [Geoglossum simile]
MSRSATPMIPLHNVSTPSNPRSPSPIPSAGRLSLPVLSTSATSTFSLLSIQETASRLSSSLAHGLSPSHAASLRLVYGPNELPHHEPDPLWLRFFKQFQEPLILLLLASAVVSFVMGNWDDAISITIAVTIVVTVGFIQEYRSEQSLQALNRLVPHFAHLLREKSDRTHNSGEQDALMDSPEPLSIEVTKTVPASQLVPGDLVIFSTGDRIPADIRITRASDLTIDESNLTGENEPVRKTEEVIGRSPTGSTLNGEPRSGNPPSSPYYYSPATGTVGVDIRLNDKRNIAFMGTLVRSGHGQGLVVATGAKTEFGAISASLGEIESPRTPLQLSMDRLGQELSWMSFVVIAVIVIIGLWQGRKLLDMFTIGVSLAVAAIPEGLPIIVTVTLALGVLRMAKCGGIVRRLPSVETLGCVNVICSDKTGTLTMNHMTVTKLWHFDLPLPVDIPKELSLQDAATRTILRVGNIANNSRLSHTNENSLSTAASSAVLSSTLGDGQSHPDARSRWVGQPTDVAMLDLLDAFGEEDVRNRIGGRIAETPFSSDRKWMGVVIGAGSGSDSGSNGRGGSEMVYVKGALEQVLVRCDRYLTKDGREVVLDESRRQVAMQAADRMAEDGLRVLGFACGPNARSAGRPLKSGASTPRLSAEKSPPRIPGSPIPGEDVYQGLVFGGMVGMNDPPRKGVDRSISRLMAGRVRVIMITGDAENTAVAIGKKLGIQIAPNSAAVKSVLTGEELDRMTDQDLVQAISTASIFARTSPEHKMKIVRALQSRGDVVAMTGDGVNDAPALKMADIGISMGLLGTDVAKEAADMILTDDDFSTILSAIEEGKGIFYNIQNFLTFQLSTSVAALSLVLLSTFFGLKTPLNPMQILWINIIMDGPPAQSLGVEPVDPAVMTRPPRSRKARVLTRAVIQRVLTSASIIMVGTMMIYIREMSLDGKITARDTTMTFTCFVLFDMFNALTCRSESKSVLRGEVGILSNKMFNFAVAASLGGQLAVIYLPWLQKVFQTEALGFFDLIGLIMVASTVFWADEGRKWVSARRRRGLNGYSTSV